MNERANEHTLNKEEFEQLLDMYIDTIVNSMSMKDLVQYVYDDMNDYLYKLTEHELINEIKYTLDDEMLDEFITTIKSNSLPYNDTKA